MRLLQRAFIVRSRAVVVLVLAMTTASQPDGPADLGQVPKLAVLPWQDRKANESLSIGLAVELTHRLQTAPDVIVREPATRLFARDAKATAHIGGSDVTFVLWVTASGEGDVQRVRWELERTADHVRLAADSSEQDVVNQPGVITSRVLQHVGANVRHEVRVGLLGDTRAYAEFVRVLGRPAREENEREMLLARIAALESVVPKLATYAPAVAALGSDYLDLAGLAGGRVQDYERATKTLERAFELDPSYPPVRAKLASLYAKIGKSERSVQLLTEGLTTHPHFAPFHETLGYVLRYAGLMEPSMASYGRGQEIDASLSNLVSTQDQITKSLIYLGDYEGAIASHRRMRSFLERAGGEPDEKQWFYEGVIHLYRGDTATAVTAFRAGAARLPNSIWTTFGRGYEAIALRDQAALAKVLEKLEHEDVVDGERHYRLVHFASFAGQVDRALNHLEISIHGGFFNALYIVSDPWLTPLRSSPRYTQLVSVAQARHDAVRRSLATASGR
jgi:tetratricopeptide (TPR) repeat protein